MIEANPDLEYDRLRKVVLHMPINNADNERERFPKDIPRRLLPQIGTLQAQQRCAAALSAHPLVQLPKYPSFPAPPRSKLPPQPSPASNHPTYPTSNSERQPRTVFSQSSSEDYSDDSGVDRQYSCAPVERKRQPYSASPGGDKVHQSAGSTRHFR